MTRSREGVVGVGGDSKAGHNRNKLDGNEIDSNEFNGGKVDNEIKKKSQKMFKSKNLFKSKKLLKSKKTGGLDFLTPKLG